MAATSISTFGSGIATVALAFAILDHGSPTDLGIIFLAREIPIVVCLLLGGVIGDRRSRSKILAICDGTRFLAQGLTAVLVLFAEAPLLPLALLQIAFGMAVAFSRPATTGLVREIADPDELQRTNALISISRSTAGIAGPAAGAVMVGLTNPGVALFADSVTFLISAVLVASLRLRRAQALTAPRLLVDLKSGWSEFAQRRWVVAMVLSFSLFQVTYFPVFLILGPAISQDQLGGAKSWGAILAAQSLGAVVGGLTALRLVVGRTLVVCCVLALPAGLLLMTLAIPVPTPILCMLAFVVGTCLAIDDTLWSTALQRNVPENALSRISSFDWLGSVALNPIGFACVGPIAATLGAPRTLAIAAVVNGGVSILPLTVRSVRQLESRPATEPVVG